MASPPWPGSSGNGHPSSTWLRIAGTGLKIQSGLIKFQVMSPKDHQVKPWAGDMLVMEAEEGSEVKCPKPGNWRTGMWIPEGWKCGTERVKGWKLPLQPMRSLSWKCLQHIQLIPLRVAAKGGWKAPRHSKENFTFLSGVLNCFKGKQNRREVGLLKVFLTHLCGAYWDKISGVGPVSAPFTWCRTNWTNYCNKYQQILSRYFPPSSRSQHLHWSQTHTHLHAPASAKPAWGCQLCPAKAGNFSTLHGNFCGEIIFFFPVYLALRGSETLQWWWGDTKSHFVVWRLQLALVYWVFFGILMGGTGDVAEKGSGRGQSMTRQTDRQTYPLHCVYINVSFPKYQAFSYKWANIPL